MAGCYGKEAEDRYFERKLYEHLDGQDDSEERLRDRVAELLIDLSDKSKAEKLCYDWELLATADTEIAHLAGECAAELARRPFDRSAPLAAFGADVLRIISDRLETVARHQLGVE